MTYCLPALVFFPFAGAILAYLVGRVSKPGRDLTAQLVAAVEFTALAVLFGRALQSLPPVGFVLPGFCGMQLSLRLDGFRALYCLIAGFMWLITTLFSAQYFSHYRNRNRYYLFALMTLGATVGVFLSADLFSTFLFFEIMSFTSYVWVAQDERAESLRAAATYLAVAVIGGLVMLFGICLLYSLCGTVAYDALPALCSAPAVRTQVYLAGGCLLFGFGAKAGAFPLHIWLPKAHPVAPAPASALLSGILTKAGIFGIAAVTVSCFAGDAKWGALILLIGVITMLLGAVLALFSVDLKRTLACSSVSQIGFILVGIGMTGLLAAENALAARGALLHMVNHSLLKLTLFLVAGVVYQNVHKLNLNEVRGFGRKKPFLKTVFLMGALGIGGIPLWNGYLSKTLLHESIVEYRSLLAAGAVYPLSGGTLGFLTGPAWLTAVEWLFLLSGGITVAYMAKLYTALFHERNADRAVQARFDKMTHYLSRRSTCALGASAVLLPLIGMLPHALADRLIDLGEAFLGSTGLETPMAYFSLGNLKGALISIAIGAALYFTVVRGWMTIPDGRKSRVYVNRWPAWLDLETLLYRPLLTRVLPFLGGLVCRFLDRLLDGILVILRKTIYRDTPLPHVRTEGNDLTDLVGGWMDAIAALFHNKSDYRHKLAMLYDDISENGMIIGRSLSFGLFMASLGLIVILLYLLVW